MTKQEVKKALKGYRNTIRKDRNGFEYCVVNLGFVNAPQNFAQFDTEELEKVTDILNDLFIVPMLRTQNHKNGMIEKSLTFYF